MGRIFFFIGEAFRALRRSAAPSMAAIVTIAVTTLLLGVLIPVLKASEETNAAVRDQIGLTAYIYDDATQSEIKSVQTEIEGLPHVESVTYVSKEDAVGILRRDLGKDSDLSTSIDLLRENPLPASFDIELDDAANLAAVREALVPPGPGGERQAISPILDPELSEARAETKQITEVTDGIKIGLIILAGLLLVASLLLVANTIRLSIYARRREVEVMKLVGATNWFIRWPFMIEGVIVGLTGAACAVGILWLGKVTIVDPLSENFGGINGLDTMGFIPLVSILVGSAMLVSALGSGVTLRRFLRV